MVRSATLLCIAVMMTQACAEPCAVRRQEGCRMVTTITPIPIVAGKIVTMTFVPVQRRVCDVDICVSPTAK